MLLQQPRVAWAARRRFAAAHNRFRTTNRTKGEPRPLLPKQSRVAPTSPSPYDDSPLGGGGHTNEQQHHNGHMLRGFLAGMHSKEIDSDGDSDDKDDAFEEAYDVLGQVDITLLEACAEDLRQQQHIHIVFGSRLVSVFDRVVNNPANDGATGTTSQTKEQWMANDEKEATRTPTTSNEDSITITRHLIFNQRPHLIQTAVTVDAVGGAPNKGTVHTPPPLAFTHLGGLALAYPLWQRCTKAANSNHTVAPASGSIQNEHTQRQHTIDEEKQTKQQQPNICLLGAGGCSLATTLAHTATSSSSSSRLTAVEVCPEVIQAAEQWFGVGPHERSFDLVKSCGIAYLESLSSSSREEVEDAAIDILLIDAEEDGVAPPRAMQTEHFWTETVMPRLADPAVVGLNVIMGGDGTMGRDGFRQWLEQCLNNCQMNTGNNNNVIVHSILPPPEAGLQGDTHALFFFRLSSTGPTDRSATAHMLDAIGRGDDNKQGGSTLLQRLVSEPEAWKRALLQRDDGADLV